MKFLRAIISEEINKGWFILLLNRDILHFQKKMQHDNPF